MEKPKKRPYTKRNLEYWNNLSKSQKSQESNSKKVTLGEEDVLPDYVSDASDVYSGDLNRNTKYRHNRASINGKSNAYLSHIKSKELPWETNNRGNISISDTIELIEKAYAHFALFRNTVDILTEFSSANIYLKGGNKSSREFVEKWLKKVNIGKLTETFFREYYRSGNVFLYKFYGDITYADNKKHKSIASKNTKIPLRYTILDPKSISLLPTTNFENAQFQKVFSGYELQRLAEPKTPEDKAILENLPEQTRKLIKEKSYSMDGITMPLSSDRLYGVFYKKQPYEPFAIPFGYSVLEDLDFKESLKSIDKAIVRTVQNVVLLITMGEKKHEYGGGVKPKAMQAMQEIFANESVTRVLVSDYTTKADFIIPEIGDILNPEKYQVVNEDIKQALLNIAAGEEKFSNQVVKMKMFLQRLEEGHKVFLNDFLQVEINNLCKQLGFNKIPEAHFEEINMQDKSQMNRVYIRLGELGFLTPEQVFYAMETGVLPEEEDMVDSQEKFIERRKEGLFTPMVGAGNFNSNEKGGENGKQGSQPSQVEGRPEGSGQPVGERSESPVGESKASRNIKDGYSLSKIQSTIESVNNILKKSEKLVKAEYSIKKLNKKQKELAFKLASSIITSCDMKKWNEEIEAAIKEPQKYLTISNEITKKIDSIAAKHETNHLNAAILYNSQYVENN